MFDIQVSPYDPLTWLVTWNGMMHRVKVPQNETDTFLSTNPLNSTLNYKAEKHTDVIPGSKLGDILNLGDLRDVDIDPGLDGLCYEFIYHKYGDCGEGCTSVQDSWYNFNINSEGAKKDYIRYVRGANVYGCPEYLDVPENLDEYWFAGWKTDGEHKQFGYYQAKPVDELPKDAMGNYIIMSQDPDTKQPVVGTLPLDCLFRNLVGSLGMNVYSTWSVIQQTPLFSAACDAVSGVFAVSWNDWRGPNDNIHVGGGQVTGRVNWESHFDMSTGGMIYKVNSVYFDRVVWKVDAGLGGSPAPKLNLKGVAIPCGTKTTLLSNYEFGDDDFEVIFDTTISCGPDALEFTVLPGQTYGPLNFLYIFVDWVGDDEGYLQLNFTNKLAAGWEGC